LLASLDITSAFSSLSITCYSAQTPDACQENVQQPKLGSVKFDCFCHPEKMAFIAGWLAVVDWPEQKHVCLSPFLKVKLREKLLITFPLTVVTVNLG
jgi:hypothetical protein